MYEKNLDGPEIWSVRSIPEGLPGRLDYRKNQPESNPCEAKRG
jgi:hypothetical protein